MISDYTCCKCKKTFKFDSQRETLILEVCKGKNLVFCSMQCKLSNFSKRQRHKFNAIACKADGIRFASKAEAAYYSRLKILKEKGEVIFFLRQVPFDLPGGIKYFVDFQVFYSDGSIDFVDVKGMSTPIFLLKKKQVENLYPIEIDIVQVYVK